ncbi:leader peptide SpeFL [Haemophilus influenzae]
MPSHRSCFSYSVFASQNKPSNTELFSLFRESP